MTDAATLALDPGSVIPVDMETTAALCAEIRRLHAEIAAGRLRPLTDAQIDRLWRNGGLTTAQLLARREIARIVERAHGIGLGAGSAS